MNTNLKRTLPTGTLALIAYITLAISPALAQTTVNDPGHDFGKGAGQKGVFPVEGKFPGQKDNHPAPYPTILPGKAGQKGNYPEHDRAGQKGKFSDDDRGGQKGNYPGEGREGQKGKYPDNDRGGQKGKYPDNDRGGQKGKFPKN
jgi:hypothetical protein